MAIHKPSIGPTSPTPPQLPLCLPWSAMKALTSILQSRAPGIKTPFGMACHEPDRFLGSSGSSSSNSSPPSSPMSAASFLVRQASVSDVCKEVAMRKSNDEARRGTQCAQNRTCQRDSQRGNSNSKHGADHWERATRATGELDAVRCEFLHTVCSECGERIQGADRPNHRTAAPTLPPAAVPKYNC